MRAISLWQPWAELIMRNLKRWETRSWAISHRGPIAIHAAKRKFRSDDMSREARQQMLLDEVDPFDLQYGCVLGFAEVTDCFAAGDIRRELDTRELLYGNYDDPLRYAWRLKGIVRLPQPIPLAGHQGIFFWRDGQELYDRTK